MKFTNSFAFPGSHSTEIRQVTSAALAFTSVEYIFLPDDGHSYLDHDFVQQQGINSNGVVGTTQCLGTLINAYGATAQIRNAGIIATVNFTVLHGFRKLTGVPVAYGRNYVAAMNLRSQGTGIIGLSSLPNQVNGNLSKILDGRGKVTGFEAHQWHVKVVRLEEDFGGQNNLIVFKVDSVVLFPLKKNLVENHTFVDDTPEISDPTSYNGLIVYTLNL